MSNENQPQANPPQQKPLTEEEIKQLRLLSINNILASNKYIVIGEDKVEIAGYDAVVARAKMQQAVLSIENRAITVMVENALNNIMVEASKQAAVAEATPTEKAEK